MKYNSILLKFILFQLYSIYSIFAYTIFENYDQLKSLRSLQPASYSDTLRHSARYPYTLVNQKTDFLSTRKSSQNSPKNSEISSKFSEFSNNNNYQNKFNKLDKFNKRLRRSDTDQNFKNEKNIQKKLLNSDNAQIPVVKSVVQNPTSQENIQASLPQNQNTVTIMTSASTENLPNLSSEMPIISSANQTLFNNTKNSNDTSTTSSQEETDFFTEILEGWTLFPKIIADWLDQKIMESKKDPNNRCSTGDLTNSFALILQMTLGFLSFFVLILKRSCEAPENRRTWLIWFLDTSKQGFSMAFMHVINVYMSEVSNKADPCTFYLTSFLLDTSIGLLIIWLGLKITEWVIQRYSILGGLPFGEYDRYGYRPSQDSNLENGEQLIGNKNTNNNTSDTDTETNNTKTKTISGNSKDQNSHSLESINILVNEPKKLQSKVSINNIDNTNLQPSDEEMNLMSYNENDRLTHLNDNNNNNNNLIDNSHQEESNSHPQKHIGQKFKFNREGMVKNFKCETWRRRFLRISFSVYFLQTGAYLAVTLIEKICVYYILDLQQLHRFYREVRQLLTQLIIIKEFEVALVMFVVPFILNCVMFWVVDNILMKGMGCLTLIGLKLGQYSFLVLKQTVLGLYIGIKRLFCNKLYNCCACWSSHNYAETNNMSNPNPINTTAEQKSSRKDIIESNKAASKK